MARRIQVSSSVTIEAVAQVAGTGKPVFQLVTGSERVAHAILHSKGYRHSLWPVAFPANNFVEGWAKGPYK